MIKNSLDLKYKTTYFNHGSNKSVDKFNILPINWQDLPVLIFLTQFTKDIFIYSLPVFEEYICTYYVSGLFSSIWENDPYPWNSDFDAKNLKIGNLRNFLNGALDLSLSSVNLKVP